MSILDRVAGAPITWGVDGSPGWGHLMDPDRVLSEMAAAGLRATELGPEGWLGATTTEVLDRLDRHGLSLIGGFVPAVLYRPDELPHQLASFDQSIATLRAGGADIVVLGAASHLAGYDQQVQLTEPEWDAFFPALERIQDLAAARDMTVATHPHWGMAVEDSRDVAQVLDRSDAGFCLDTGHLALAGVDMGELVDRAADRIHHVHLKDVDPDLAGRVRGGDIGFRRAVVDGLFRPLGQGEVDVAALVGALERRGFAGWYVLEQDLALSAEPDEGHGPIVNVQQSISFLRHLRESWEPQGLTPTHQGA